MLCLLSVSRSINVWLKKQARCALIQHTTCFHKDKRRNLQKQSLAAKEVMRKIRAETEWKEERFTLLADNVDKNRIAGW